MKWPQWGMPGALLVLVFGTGTAYFVTRETSRPLAQSTASNSAQAPLVDDRPLPTARALAMLAITPEEQRFAAEAA